MNDLPGRPLRIGTRSSPMALAQTEHVAGLLRGLVPGLRAEPVPVTTRADRWHGDLAKAGGKGLFVKEIDVQLQDGTVDLAVHCLKDMPGDQPLPDGIVVAAMPRRADPRDVLVVPEGSEVSGPAELPAGATVATSSVRRRAQLLRRRPDLRVVAVRGAIGSRLARLDGTAPPREGEIPADAMVVARSGLERLGLTHRISYAFPVDTLLPPVGAGVLALQCRADDTPVRQVLARLDDPVTHREAAAERAMLRVLRGHCNSPIAGHCRTGEDGRLALRGMVFDRDGGRVAHAGRAGAPAAPEELGAAVADDLLDRGARSLIEGVREQAVGDSALR